MNPTDAPVSGTSRRQLITTGAFGAAAAALLAACGTKADKSAGQSGADPTPTAVPPEPPAPEASEADLAYDTDLLRTATSLELLAADLYEEYAPGFGDAEWVANAERFAADHQAAADAFREETEEQYRVDEPNQYLIENSVEPVSVELDKEDPAVLLNFFAALESTLAATYISAVSSYSQVEGRAMFAGYAEAAARRQAVMGNRGEGAPPTSALYPLQDLIPNEAYVTVIQADAGVEEESEDESGT